MNSRRILRLGFAKMANQCDNTPMIKLSHFAVIILAGATILSGSALAQDTPATPATSQQAPAAAAPKAAPAKTAQTGATSTGAKKTPATAAKKPAPLVLKTPKEKASYAMGMNMGKNFHKNGV